MLRKRHKVSNVVFEIELEKKVLKALKKLDDVS